MIGFPCKNRSCKSYGKPHPNCHCYGYMTAGGDVTHYCSTDQMHQKDCEYFAEGGAAEDEPLGGFEKNDTPTWGNTSPIGPSEPTWENTTAAEPTWENTNEKEEPTWVNTTGKYETLPQQIATGVEGVAQGFAGPLATLAEKGLSKLGIPGMSDEDMKGRQESNPATFGLSEVAGLGTGLLTGTGEAALIGKGVSGLAKLAKVGEGIEAAQKVSQAVGVAAKLGSAALQGAMQTGLLQFGDNLSKSLIGQGDPNEGIASTLTDGLGISSLIGAAVGGLGSVVSQGLSKLGEMKQGTYLHSFLSGIGEAANGIDPEQSYAKFLNEKAYNTGVKFWNNKIILPGAIGSIEAGHDLLEGVKSGDISGGAKDAAIDLAKSAAMGLGIKVLAKPAAAVLLKALSTGEGNPRAIFPLVDYANKANSGAQKMTRAIENLFKIGGQQLNDKYDFEKHRSKLDKYIEDGGINQNIDEAIFDQNQPQEPAGYAEGGEVKKTEKHAKSVPPLLQENDPIAKHLPEQNMLLNAAKARISNYLTSLRPKKNQPKLAFDQEPDQTAQKRSYDRALDIAVNPMGIMAHINKGTIEPEHLRHFNALYPEINGVLQKKITEKIVDSQLSGKKPSYAVRQGLSMMLGTPLCGELSPQNIQAIQATFQKPQTPQPGQATAPKKNTAKLTKSNQAYLTGNQALVGRQQRQS